MASISKRKTAAGDRYDVNYRTPEGAGKRKTFAKAMEARAFAATIEVDKLRGAYIDPSAGKVTFEQYASEWLEVQTFDRSTHEAVSQRLRLHVFPVLGARQLRTIRPSTIQGWLSGLQHLAPRTRQVMLVNVSAIFSAAIDDELIAKNPCSARAVTKPKADDRKLTPWPLERLQAVHDALPDRYQIAVTIGAGLGLRQGEIFGLSPDDVDFLRGVVMVRRQVKLFADGHQRFAPPKGRKVRTVPLAGSVRDELAAHLAAWPTIAVALPGEPDPVPLVMTTRERSALVRTYINHRVWKPALRAAGVPATRENGMHALRHLFASVLLDGGESIKAVSEYLGHADPGFTLRVYAHVMPSSDERSKRVIDAALARSAHVPIMYPTSTQQRETSATGK